MPADRHHEGLMMTMSVRENAAVAALDRLRTGRLISRRREVELVGAELGALNVKARSMESPVTALSGGNQQKVVVAREFSRPLKVLIAAQPTRGVDVGSIEFIHKRIIEERDKGTAVIIVSTELDEIFALSDRIAVMYDGRIVATVTPDIAREDIGLMMAGAHEPAEEVSA
jgi:simple sugar transport system ATP-binding protein